jgi:hypothetical protein
MTKTGQNLLASARRLDWRRATLFATPMAVIGVVVVLVTLAAGAYALFEPEGGTLSGGATVVANSGASGGSAIKFGHGAALPAGVTLRPIDGGPNYFASKSSKSSWLDQHFLFGAWLEQPLNATEVGYDMAMGSNIYWNLAGHPGSDRADYDVIRSAGMHVSAPDISSKSGAETVAYDGTDEADMIFGPGSNAWNNTGGYDNSYCVPSGSNCGYTVASWAYTGQPSSNGITEYPINGTAIHQGYGKGVLFWESESEAATFMNYTDILSADSYWMTDPDLQDPSQGGCSLFPASATICNNGSGTGLSQAQSRLPANYQFDVSRLQAEQAINGASKPVAVDIETGCPFNNNLCITPPAMLAAAFHSIIAGARGIIWFQHNFSGPCTDFRTLIDGSNSASSMYNCQQTPGVTLHNLVQSITSFTGLLNGLNSVLLSPFADGYFSSTGTVSAMAKYDGTNFYIFAGSGKPGTPPSANQSVTFTIKNTGATSVTVVGESRTLPVSNGTTFVDAFADANSYHIYKVN